MCRAIDEMMAEAREEGRESLMTNMMRNFSGPAYLGKKSAVLSRRRIFPEISCATSWEKACGKRF